MSRANLLGDCATWVLVVGVAQGMLFGCVVGFIPPTAVLVREQYDPSGCTTGGIAAGQSDGSSPAGYGSAQEH